MPWINLTARRGALTPQKRHALFADLTSALMFWEKVPDTPEARSFMKGWYYEVAEDADYNGGIHEHEKAFYFIEVRMPAGRLTTLDRLGIIRDFTKLVMMAEGSDMNPENTRRVWVTIVDIDRDNWGIGGSTDWLRSYTSALDSIHSELKDGPRSYAWRIQGRKDTNEHNDGISIDDQKRYRNAYRSPGKGG